MDTEATIVDRPDAKPIDSLKKEIEFRNVSFRYDDGDRTLVLKNVSLTVQPGEVIALVGSTGGGKTTLVNLLARFYEPTEGEIAVGGNDYREFELSLSIQARDRAANAASLLWDDPRQYPLRETQRNG